jgi:hypothetical protein
MRYHKVNGIDGLMRDSHTNHIINTNQIEYQNYMKLVSAKRREKEKIENLENNLDELFLQTDKIKNLENDVNHIKNDLEEIKNLLRNLANGS